MGIEIWKDIKGFEGLYQISNYGRVKRLSKKVFNKGLVHGKEYFISKEIILKNATISKGYQGVTLTKNKKRYSKKVHRLVAEAFIPNPENKSQINHIDCNKKNNCVDNLEWNTQSENLKHAFKNGLTVNGLKKANYARWHKKEEL
jgi:hypothetical protein